MAADAWVVHVVVPRVEQLPVDQVVRALEAPREKHVAARWTIPDRVACGQESATERELETQEGERLIDRVQIAELPAEQVTRLPSAERRAEGSDLLAHRVWVLPHGLVSHRAQVEEHATLVEVGLVEELSRSDCPSLRRM